MLNATILTKENLTTNWGYRNFMQHNAPSIMVFNQNTADGTVSLYSSSTTRNPVPLSSDLKKKYLQQLQVAQPPKLR
jgi:hypothetical protein